MCLFGGASSDAEGGERRPVVAVVGAGFSGVTAVKACLEEGLEPICFEMTDNIGGLWRFRKEDIADVASVMKTTTINTSKEMSAFSDFPPPSEFPNFMHNSLIVKYLEMYCERFDLFSHIRLLHKVVRIEKAPDFGKTGQWLVVTLDMQTDRESKMLVSAVMVCTGHHVVPNIPTFPGIEEFRGQVMHSHSYKDFHGMEDKRILIVGIGNSAMDLSVELSRVTPNVLVSTRHGAWVIAKLGSNGIPNDLTENTRFMKVLPKLLPTTLWEKSLIDKMNHRFDHERYKIRPAHGPTKQPVVISDEFPSRVLTGTVVIKGEIDHFTPRGVYFKGEDAEHPIDVVILATGFTATIPFLSSDVLQVHNHRITLYKRVLPPRLEHPTLAVIGLVQPRGALFPASEIQSRWAVQVFKGKLRLPSAAAMMDSIRLEQDALDDRNGTRGSPVQQSAIQVDYIPYMDSIAEELGVKPNFREMLFRDPKLFVACVFGPCLASQYRLRGPHAWPGARQSILDVWARVDSALNTRKTLPSSCFELLHPEGGFGRVVLAASMAAAGFFLHSFL